MIARQTSLQAYQLNRGGVRARMVILRMIAKDSAQNFNPHTRLQPWDWRGARAYTLFDYRAAFGYLEQGFNGKESVWYCHTGEQFRNERYCDEIARSIHHSGWYCDQYQYNKARGVVAHLPHGKFVAGYEISDSGERVYFDATNSDELDLSLIHI